MVEPTPIRRPIDLTRDVLRTDEAERLIRLRAANSANVGFSTHAFERAEEREEQECLNTEDALAILREGFVMQAPQKCKDGWKCKVVKNILGNRDAGVVTIIVLKTEGLRVVTVEWEDVR